MQWLRQLPASVLLTLGLATPALAEPALWKISDDDSAIYLFGSVHMFPYQLDWRSDGFNRLLATADHVWFEVVMDVEAYSTITRITMTQGFFRDGRSLRDVLEPADFARLAAAATAVGSDVTVLEGMQPWFAAMTLGDGARLKATAGVELLVDAEVAPERKRGLETAAEQMGFLADVPMADQVDALMSAVEGIEAGVSSQLVPMIEAWRRGNTAELGRVIEAQITDRDRAMYKRILTDRNHRWLDQLEALLADNDESLVIVGAAHLVGNDGVQALLRDRGYAVERIDGSATVSPAAGPGKPPKRR